MNAKGKGEKRRNGQEGQMKKMKGEKEKGSGQRHKGKREKRKEKRGKGNDKMGNRNVEENDKVAKVDIPHRGIEPRPRP